MKMKMAPKISSTNPQPLEAAIHIISWLLIFGFPLLLIERGSSLSTGGPAYLRHLLTPMAFGIVFYTNYSLLVPRLLFKKEHRKRYYFYNVLLVVGVTLMLHFLAEWLRAISPEMPLPHRMERPHLPPRWIFTARDMLMMCCTAGLAAAIRMSREWKKAETARREAERARTEAELTNLRNQLNPHFLLNTLNNIYALIAFDTDKAQQAVMDLSKLLRHLLYDNRQTYVPLLQEVAFIRNYVELMRIRLAREVEVKLDIRIRPETDTLIAPLIFISLIENAFKHGISPSAPCYVHIALTEDEDGNVKCTITNSNFPKNSSDKSGSGIGLEQVRRRLELLYPKRYEWQRGICDDGRSYRSELTIRRAAD